LSVSHRPFFLPVEIGGKSIFYWFDKFGILNAPSRSFIGRRIQSRPDPIFGMELKQRIKSTAIELLSKTTAASTEGIHFSDGSIIKFENVIWCTGFQSRYEWLDIPDVHFQQNGSITHNHGITTVKGLYLVGMPWQTRRTSALIGGVGEDAKSIAHIINQTMNSTT
jgi:putative flavoprotein involved in K+ transport